jgi:hypothetical protein
MRACVLRTLFVCDRAHAARDALRAMRCAARDALRAIAHGRVMQRIVRGWGLSGTPQCVLAAQFPKQNVPYRAARFMLSMRGGHKVAIQQITRVPAIELRI